MHLAHERNRVLGRPVAEGLNDENVITIEIRGHEPAAVAAAQRISELFLSSGPCWLWRTPGVAELQWRVSRAVTASRSRGRCSAKSVRSGSGLASTASISGREPGTQDDR